MKTLKCDQEGCEHEQSAETFEAWMEAMKAHYGEAHADYMKEKGGLSEDEQMASMKVWMEANKARFEAEAK